MANFQTDKSGFAHGGLAGVAANRYMKDNMSEQNYSDVKNFGHGGLAGVAMGRMNLPEATNTAPRTGISRGGVSQQPSTYSSMPSRNPRQPTIPLPSWPQRRVGRDPNRRSGSGNLAVAPASQAPSDSPEYQFEPERFPNNQYGQPDMTPDRSVTGQMPKGHNLSRIPNFVDGVPTFDQEYMDNYKPIMNDQFNSQKLIDGMKAMRENDYLRAGYNADGSRPGDGGPRAGYFNLGAGNTMPGREKTIDDFLPNWTPEGGNWSGKTFRGAQDALNKHQDRNIQQDQFAQTLNQNERNSRRTANTSRLKNLQDSRQQQFTNKMATQRLGLDTDKATQDQMNKLKTFEAKPGNILQSELFKSIAGMTDENKRNAAIGRIEAETGYRYEDLLNFRERTTQPRMDDNGFPMLPSQQ